MGFYILRNSQTSQRTRKAFCKTFILKTCCVQPDEEIEWQYEKKKINVLFIRVIIYYELVALLILWIMQKRLNSMCTSIVMDKTNLGKLLTIDIKWAVTWITWIGTIEAKLCQDH